MTDNPLPLPKRQLIELRESWPEPRPQEVQDAIDRLAVECGEAPPRPSDTQVDVLDAAIAALTADNAAKAAEIASLKALLAANGIAVPEATSAAA